ncbi:ATP-binding cassette domain-containing protein [Streptomyces sp. 3MP-14]|uniref:ATP-binding cassette domain-containing protein n=1 Tax=Streptomyces mimosae TaxID=2586635 RepID=A0A5N6A9H3_9ACTN|nr:MULTISPECIES: ABC transporter ATP-binding protein [Streptomyces]KAB8164653.1 ATP-binding cassette domain-containing protein [Streptomyces mimosae]KAB8175569.1 ATP-binding cassette domain-containing protein [Streptomyces sp. 3MP-14]
MAKRRTSPAGGRAATAEQVVRARGVVVEVPGRRLADGLELAVAPGESVALMGPSGSGKTTVLNTLAGLVRPAAGTVEIGGEPIGDATPDRAAAMRLTGIGMVFQFGELMPELDVLENVALPAAFAGLDEAADRARRLLERVGLVGFEERAPEELSGGEAQRAAIARALVCAPRLVLADEPTGALDEANARRVTAVLLDACRAADAALVVATHDPAVAAAMDRTLLLRDGRLHPLPAPTTEPAPAADR